MSSLIATNTLSNEHASAKDASEKSKPKGFTGFYGVPIHLTPDCPRCGRRYSIKYRNDPGMCDDCNPASGRDAAGTRDAGGQGRPSFSPETTRRHMGLYAMAIEGLDIGHAQRLLDVGYFEVMLKTKKFSPPIAVAIAKGVGVLECVASRGPDGVVSIEAAHALRMLLGEVAGRFDGIAQDTLALDGVSQLNIAEIRMGIRHRNGDLRREWM